MKKKKHLEDTEGNVFAEEETAETMWDFISSKADHFFVNHIPFDSIKDMSATCKITELSNFCKFIFP